MVQCNKSNNKVPRPYPYVILSASEISHLCLYVILSASEISHDLSTEKLPQKLPDNKEKNGCL